MPTAFFEDFETDGNGTRYTTSIDEFINTGRRDARQFFSRTDDSGRERNGDQRFVRQYRRIMVRGCRLRRSRQNHAI